MEALIKEKSNQKTIELFRKNVQDIHDWFNTILKRMEVLDKGSGLSCPEKLKAIIELTNEFNNLGPKKLEDVKNIVTDVINVVNNLDSQQVEEQVFIFIIKFIINAYLLFVTLHLFYFFILVKICGKTLQ